MKTGKINVSVGRKWWVNPLCNTVLVLFNLHLIPVSAISGFAIFITRHGVRLKGVK